jgi:hypothetical protein
MTQTIKVGPKKRHLDIPDGWELIKTGYTRKTDQYANIHKPCWDNIEETDIGLPCEDLTVIREIPALTQAIRKNENS